MEHPISEAFAKLCSLALQRGFKDLAAIDGCFEHDVDADWHITLNAHNEMRADSQGCPVQPFNMVVTHNDFPVGVIGPGGGALLEGAEADFIAALDAQLEAADAGKIE